jgi:hypothetical protein
MCDADASSVGGCRGDDDGPGPVQGDDEPLPKSELLSHWVPYPGPDCVADAALRASIVSLASSVAIPYVYQG